MDNEDDVIKLQTFISNMTPNAIFRLTRLDQYRNETVEQYAVFRQNIKQVLEKQAWTGPIRGRCGWEQEYFSIRNKE